MPSISGWGRYPRASVDVVAPRSAEQARVATAAADGLVARGNGRSYGDASIGALQSLSTRSLDRFRHFDAADGTATFEAGVLLSDIIARFAPRGWFPPVVPGTRLVTVGGAIAADVHGKNHHRDGGFGAHVASLRLALPSGEVIQASREEHAEIFRATIGGMGLTGTILEATIRLRPIETGWIRQDTLVAPDLARAIALLDEGDAATYSVAWIDCLARGASLGRSIVFLGEHAAPGDLTGASAAALYPPIGEPRLSVPFDLPGIVLNPLSIRAFNALYYGVKTRKAGRSALVPAAPYFFPLDGIGEWNRIYGPGGFVQHQSVVPLTNAHAVLAEMLDFITRRGDASFLAVLKKLGSAPGLLSFPFPGYTLALDFPVRPGLLAFLDELDEIVVRASGRIYLAKDARQSRATFEAGYANAGRFRAIRRELDPEGRIRSRLADRLAL